MNAKRCKRIRCYLRDAGIDPKQRRYREVVTIKKFPSRELDDDGTPKMIDVPRITIRLTDGCGRGMYKAMKAA